MWLSAAFIYQLVHLALPEGWVWWIAGGVALLVTAGLLTRWRVNRMLNKANEKNLLHNQLFELENKALKAQMNPHFMFNSLNTIQLFIIVNENEKAQQYLSKFARLVRKMLESNIKDSIELKEEIDLLEHYLEIESMRFNAVFNYKTVIKGGCDPSIIHIPHFLIQPFIENAIWHGLLPKDGDKTLLIFFEQLDEKTLGCIIDDNGVGYNDAADQEQLKEKKSLAINFIKQRLQLMSRMKRTNYGVTIENKTDANHRSLGTRVHLRIPIISYSNPYK